MRLRDFQVVSLEPWWLLARCSGETFVITKHGEPRAAAERLESIRGMLSGMTREELRADPHAGHRY